MTTDSPPLVKVLLADMLAVAGGVAMYLRTQSILWVPVGALLGGAITLTVLAPMLRAAADAKKVAASKGGDLVR